MRKWTKERFVELANKYEYAVDFKKDNDGCYQVALKRGWWKDYKWAKKRASSRLKWTEEKIIDAMRQCSTIVEFQKKFPVAARHARLLHLINNPERISKDHNYPILKHAPKRHSKYDYNTCYSIALKCKTKKEMREKFSSAYAMAQKKKWLANYHWLKKSSPISFSEDNRIWVVYAWTFEPSHSAYIGLTRQFKRRIWEEKNRTKETVYKHLLKTNDSYNVKICLDELNAAEAQEQENFFVQHYKFLGYKILNKFKTGLNISSLGGGVEKWSFEKCKEFAEKCGSYSEFSKASSFAYNMCRYKGWIDNFNIVDDRKKRLSEIECQNMAKQCKTLSEFRKRFNKAYASAIRYGYKLPYLERKKINVWTNEELEKVAKRYTSLKVFSQKEKSAYAIACHRKLLNSFTWLKRIRIKQPTLTKFEKEQVESAKKRGIKIRNEREYIYKRQKQIGKTENRRQQVLEKMALFKTSYDLYTNDIGTYRAAISFNLLKEHYNQPSECVEAAKLCENATEFKQKYHLLYMVAQRLRLFKSLEYAKPRHTRSISDEQIKKAASRCKTKKEFRQKFPSEYNAVSTYHLYHLIEGLKSTKPHEDGFWNEKNILEASKKYKTFAQFHDNDKGAWAAAKKKNLFDRMTWLTHKRANTLYTVEYIKELCLKNKIHTMTELYKFNKSAYNAISRRGYKQDMDSFFVKINKNHTQK